MRALEGPAVFYNFSEPPGCELGLHSASRAALTHGEHSFRSTLPQAFLLSPRSLISGIKLNFFWRWLTQTHDRFFPRYPTPYVYFILALFWMYWTQVTYSFYMLKYWWRAINSLKKWENMSVFWALLCKFILTVWFKILRKMFPPSSIEFFKAFQHISR